MKKIPQNTLTINNSVVNASNASLSAVPGASLVGVEELLRGLTGWENTAENIKAQEVQMRDQGIALQEAAQKFQGTPNAITRMQYKTLLNEALAQAKTHQHYCEKQQQDYQKSLDDEQAVEVEQSSYFAKFSKLAIDGVRYIFGDKHASQNVEKP